MSSFVVREQAVLPTAGQRYWDKWNDVKVVEARIAQGGTKVTHLRINHKCLLYLFYFKCKFRASQGKKIQKIRGNFGSGWVGPGLTRNGKTIIIGKSSENNSTYWCVGVVYHVYFVRVFKSF